MNYDDDTDDAMRWVRKQFALFRLEQAFLNNVDDGDDDGDTTLETKTAVERPLAWKQIDIASGVVTGYGATYDLDLGKDAITPGAFKKTLDVARTFAVRHKSPALLPVLWQHQREEPIGYVSDATEDTRGLRCTFIIDPTIERGRQALTGLKHGTLSFSIGYRPVQFAWKGSTRILQEISLAEISVVTFPMNPEARASQ